MGIILTPTQYNPVLEGLNALRPLHVGYQVGHTLDIPVADKLAVSPADSKAAEGTLVKTTEHGKLLALHNKHLTDYEVFIEAYEGGTFETTLTFEQEVQHVIVEVTNTFLVDPFIWTDDSFTAVIQDLNSLGVHNLTFKGKVLKLYAVVGVILLFDVYGFY